MTRVTKKGLDLDFMGIYWIVLVSVLLQERTTFPELAQAANEARDANKLEEAIALYEKALAAKPTWAEGWFSVGTIDYDQNHYEDAAEAFSKAVKIDAKAGTARIMLGLSEFELDRDRAALADLQKGIALGFANDEQLRNVAVFHEGVLLQRAGQFEAALDALRPLCAAGVESEQLMTTAGLAVLHARDKFSASTVTQRAGHAECLGYRKQIDEAQREYRALVQEFPKYPNVHYAYGRFLLQMKHHLEEAVAEFKTELANQPNSAAANRGRRI